MPFDDGSARDDADARFVAAALGRAPRARYRVVARMASPDAQGEPTVIENPPYFEDGTPMPTRYWLVHPRLVRDVSRLESAGGVKAAERAVSPEALAGAHRRHEAGRDALIDPPDRQPRPSGGVGGTRRGVKCLHTHYAWFLAGGDDPVGRWVQDQLDGGGSGEVDR